MYLSGSSQTTTPAARTVVCALTQPLTVTQLALRLKRRQDTCSRQLAHLCGAGLVQCLNDSARRGRVYARTAHGRVLARAHGYAAVRHDAQFNWTLYGWVCFSHRTAILLALDAPPLCPAAIKRRARYQHPALTMSANNVRDVIRLFLRHGLVAPVHERKRAHPTYALTDLGRQLQHLLLTARGPS